MRLTTTTKTHNYWINRNGIPLGRSAYDGRIITKRVPMISDNIIVSAMPGRGKSVLVRLLIWFISQVRPVIVFDWEGEDHKLSYKKNSSKENLPPENDYSNKTMKPEAVARAEFFNYTNELDNHEKRAKPNIENYSADELRGLGFPPGASMKLREIIKTYSPFKDLRQLFDFIQQFPTTERDAIKKYQNSDLRKKHHGERDTMPTQTKQSLLTYLYRNMI